MKRKFEIRFLEISYVPMMVSYDEDGKEIGGSARIGRSKIECKYIPEDLQTKIVKFIVDAEKAH